MSNLPGNMTNGILQCVLAFLQLVHELTQRKFAAADI